MTAHDYPEVKLITEYLSREEIPLGQIFIDPDGAEKVPFIDRPVFMAAVEFAAANNAMIAITNDPDVAANNEMYLEMQRLAAAEQVGILNVDAMRDVRERPTRA